VSLIEDALARQAAAPAPRPIDYERMRRVHPRQKAALTKAVNRWRAVAYSGPTSLSPEYIEGLKNRIAEEIAKVCKAAVEEWNAIGAWPDDWSTWQVALNDVLPRGQSIDIGDL
jgi:hypothetical protein